jgi:serine/threonine-protein kinase
MSPEQAAGKPADKRSDLWAFGIVLFEMLTARPVFAGETVSDMIAGILEREPDWAALPAETPSSIQTLLRRCLGRDRKRRLESAADARLEIDDAIAAPPATGPLVGRPRATWQNWSTAATVLTVAVVAGASVWIAMRQAEPAPPRVSRLPLALPRDAALTVNGAGDLAITPDGSRVIYVGNRGTQLFVRALDAFEPVALFTGFAARPVRLPRWPVDRVHGRQQGVEETGRDRRAAGHVGDARRLFLWRHVGAGGRDHRRDW